MANWIRTENGGFSDTEQQVPWKDILQWQVDMFFYSCYLYYVKDNPKLDDAGFDRIIEILEQYYEDLPDRIKHTCGPGQIKATSHLFAHDLTEQEISSALKWRND